MKTRPVEDSSAAPAPLTLLSRYHGNALLHGIEAQGLALFDSEIEHVVCESEQIIFDEGDTGDALYLIASGAVKISKRGRGGKQETLCVLESGSFFGEMALLDSEARSARATASEGTSLGKVNRQAWNTLLNLAPQALMVNFTRTATQRLRNNNQHFIEAMLRNERLSMLGTTVASIMHDVRSPLHSVMGAAEYIERTSSEEISRSMASIAGKSAVRIEEMVRELLDFSRGTIYVDRQPVDMAALFSELESHEFSRCQSAGIRVVKRVDFFGRLNLDLTRFSRILTNLVRNAREAMPHGGEIVIGVEATETDARITIVDNGTGIPEDLLPTIFEPFVTHGKAGGTGLGLSIAKAVAEAHDGNITVQSTRNRGTTFTITLPGCVVH